MKMPAHSSRLSVLACVSVVGALTLVATTAAPRGQAAAVPGGTITGQIMFSGTPPRPQRIRMTSDPLCMPGDKGDLSEALVVGKDNGIQNVFVYVKDGLGAKTYPAPQTTVRLDQRGCRYVPHVFGLQVGQPLLISNDDPAVHNVHSTPKLNPEINMIQPKGTKPITKTFAKPEVMIPIRCDTHPWMTSWVGVVAHPFFAVSAADGRFTIKGLPPGTYTIEAWTETLGTQTQKVTVAATKGAAATFTFKK